ncbi:MAG: hypothetical protein R6U30_02395 [Halomonas sp.]|uniref:hypothetical protein n=1 Tax=Halomonas sp. TaxID=1486246 RepID=UPI00384C8AD3
MDPVTLRALERILVVLFAGMAIYLGYRLFLAVPTQRGSDGKVTLPGGAEVILNRAAPGLFFALFGSIALGISLYSAVQATHAPLNSYAPAEIGGESTWRHYSGVVPTGAASPGRQRDVEFELAQLRRLLFTLNALDVVSSAEGADAVARRSDLRQVKLRLLEGAWQGEWGHYADFAAWVGERDARDDPPDVRFSAPASLYRHGEVTQ